MTHTYTRLGTYCVKREARRGFDAMVEEQKRKMKETGRWGVGVCVRGRKREQDVWNGTESGALRIKLMAIGRSYVIVIVIVIVHKHHVDRFLPLAFFWFENVM